MSETRLKILDTAERLFGEDGYKAVSLRHITAAAGVNLAAIHYYFGSKEELLDELVMRKAVPVNEERMERLRRLKEAAAPNPIALEDLLEAFMLPAFHTADKSPEFTKLMGRLHAEGVMPEVARKHFGPVGGCFLAEMRRSLPGLAEDDLAWRVHFMIGAMAHGLKAPPLEMLGRTVPEPPSEVSRRIVAFLCGGFRAPVAALEKVEVK
ncbi:MAG: TetR/AcrR family transcriptional regulator [Bryobacteraceae bacterium]|jgi:AcrR family transcriptional regulator